MQLARRLGGLVAGAALVASGAAAFADDRADATTTWYMERRPGDSLTVLHPQVDLGFDVSESVTVNGGYEVDVVTGATASIYAPVREGVDAVSSATSFDDVRHAGRVSLGIIGSRSTLSLGYGFGTERDYRSHTVTGAASVNLPGKNTTLGIDYTHNFDSVCDYDNGDAGPLERRALTGADGCFGDGDMTLTRDLSIDTTQAAITQNLTPTAVLQAGVFGQLIQGFQSNPYRRVRVAGLDAQENIPRTRSRGAAFVRLNVAFPRLKASGGMAARAYSDTWGVTSGSFELSYHQYLATNVLFRLRGRAYQQSGAVFFRDAIDYQNVGPAGEYFTGDRELSPMRDMLAGGRLSWISSADEGRPLMGFAEEFELHLNAEGIWFQSLTETAPGGDVTGPIPDAITVQLGAQLRY